MPDLSSILAGTEDFQTPEEVERRRRQGTALFNQGTSVAPLQHWTQALARGVQGGLGGYEIGQARDQEQGGKAAANSALIGALTGKQSPTDTIGTMLKNPWSADAGQKMAGSYLSSQMQQNTPQAQLALKKAKLEYDMALETRPLEVQKLKLAIDALKEQSAQDKWIFGEARAAGAGPAGTPTASAGGAAPSTPVLQGTSFGPWQAGGQPSAPSTPMATATVTPGTPDLSERSIRAVLASRPMADRQMFASVYSKDRVKAMEMIRDWSDPNKKQDEARQKEVGESQGKAQASLPTVTAATDRLLNQIDRILYEHKPDPSDPDKMVPVPDAARPGKFKPNPVLEDITGPVMGSPYRPAFTKGGAGVALEERIKQIGGGAFLQAFEALKGGGAIQEKEGEKATSALARIANLQQGTPEFREAVREFRDEVVRLRQLAFDRASGKIPMPVQQQATQGALAPIQGAQQAPDGNWYVPDPSRPGKFLRVDQ